MKLIKLIIVLVVAVVVILGGTYGIMRYDYNKKFDYTSESVEIGGLILPYESITTVKITNNSKNNQTPKIIVNAYDINGKNLGSSFVETKLDGKEISTYILTINCGNSKPADVKIKIRRYSSFL